MVYGLEKFHEYFKECTNQYVFIGGTACDIILGEIGAPFRATKDLDIVLIVEALDASFGEIFWRFIEDGGYENREKSAGMNQFYRYSKPKEAGYPVVIELFSRLPANFELKFNSNLTPIHIDDSIISLSAILLDDAYYDLLIRGKQIVAGYSVIDLRSVILFKMKAWIDMKSKVEAGEHIDSQNIKKHKNDVFRLLSNLIPDSPVEVATSIKDDIIIFIEKIQIDQPDLRMLGIKNTSLEDFLELIDRSYC